MVTITNVNLNTYTNDSTSGNGNFQIESNIKGSKIVNFFELLYSHPSKYKIKWNALDELKTDLFLPSKYDTLENNLPDHIDDWFFSASQEEGQPENSYNLSDLREGLLDKNYSSNFYRNQTKNIQKALSSIPVYVVLNGLNEIVLTKPHNNENSQATIKQTIYNYCGAFDSSFEKRQQVGFFFMTYSAAETYLQEIAKSDINGTEMVGLSIHCISLDSAYNITREYHPGTDFRIIPDLSEVKNLLTKHLTKSSIIIEDEQHQLRLRRRSVNIIPAVGKLGRLLSPSSSFLQRSEYFKGVPIYIVQTLEQPRNIATMQYLNTVSLLDTVCGRFIQTFDSLLGYGQNWVIQGSIKDANASQQFTNYIFFDELSATKFVKNNEKIIAHYQGSRISNLESLVRKPKIFVYNLEDFVELWEEKIHSEVFSPEKSLKTIFNAKTTLFIPPEETYKKVQFLFENSNSTPVSRITQQLLQQINVKSRVFKNFVGTLFSVGY